MAKVISYPGFGTIWKFESILSAMEKEAWEPADEAFDGGDPHDETRRVYLGSWLNSSPSGKIYMPWSSNITEAEANQDEDWREYTDAGLHAHGMFLEESDGDLFAYQIRPAGIDD